MFFKNIMFRYDVKFYISFVIAMIVRSKIQTKERIVGILKKGLQILAIKKMFEKNFNQL